MRYQLRQVTHEEDFDGTETFTLDFHRGSEEARVTITKDDDELDAECQVLPADSLLDEDELEEIARTWARQHAGAMGDVGRL